MKLKMTVDEALEFADEWSRGLTLNEGSQGWRVVCMLLAEEVRRMREAGSEAAYVLRQEATNLRDCHTLNGEWDGTESEAQAVHDMWMAISDRLTPNDRVEGRDAALSRRVPSHDGLCGNGNYNERTDK